MDYRPLTDAEIEAMENQDCWAEDWKRIRVKEGFIPTSIRRVRFAGDVRLGIFQGFLKVDDGIRKPSGLNQAFVQDCAIGDHVYIADVKNLLRYDISDDVVIENVASLTVSGETRFGNGVEIEVINEGGGRTTMIFDRMSSQIAYLQALYRHDSVFITELRRMIHEYVDGKKADRGTIGQGARILHAGRIHNVSIGEQATISGALHLEEGTIVSNAHDPVFIGEGVIARSFIVQSGSRADGSASLDGCFVGQGVRIGRQFSAENSCFFANAEGFHGEACSVFAGPYTVTHHKSTLLIAGLFSFFNAGSGSNQSNHMYKLGPVHQGILERGAKTGSYSYLMWPCRVGAFTSVIGKHAVNFDTTDFPFSYILESDGKSILIPGVNLTTVGTKRDSAKWPARDRRRDPEKLDLIHFALFSPYTIGKILRGIDFLKHLDQDTSSDDALVEYLGVMIKRSKLSDFVQTYETAVHVYIGDELVKRLEAFSDAKSISAIRNKLHSDKPDALGPWVDVSGLLAPAAVVEQLMESVRTGRISTLDDLIRELRYIHADSEAYAWAWCMDLIQKRFGIDYNKLTKNHLIQIIKDWKRGSLDFISLILKDGEKEFSQMSRMGYGIDGGDEVVNKDFDAVRGRFDENPFVLQLREESLLVEERAEKLLAFLQGL